MGRPPAALVSVGTVCSASVTGPVIQVIVPAVTVAASSSILGPSAATTTSGAGASAKSRAACAVTVSPLIDAPSPRSSGMSASRYSRMCRSGFSNE